jgi:hypothetical protein
MTGWLVRNATSGTSAGLNKTQRDQLQRQQQAHHHGVICYSNFLIVFFSYIHGSIDAGLAGVSTAIKSGSPQASGTTVAASVTATVCVYRAQQCLNACRAPAMHLGEAPIICLFGPIRVARASPQAQYGSLLNLTQ